MKNMLADFSCFIKRHALSLVVLCSVAVLLLRLYLKSFILPEIVWSNDYYGYILLGRGIFSDFSFIVNWYWDFPVAYPPLFSIVIQFVNFLTKNPVEAIRVINILGLSFAPVFLYMAARKIFTTAIALTLVPFAHYYIGLTRPLQVLRGDFFFVFLTTVLFWLIWKIASNPIKKPGIFLWTGFLISLTFLTKFQGIIYLFVAIVSVCMFHVPRVSISLRRKIILILVGFLPLYISYQAIITHAKHDRQLCDVAVATLLHTNNDYFGNRGNQLYTLNKEGREFLFWDDCRSNTIVSVFRAQGKLLGDKYLRGIKQVSYSLTRSIFPFLPRGCLFGSIIFLGPLLVVVGLTTRFKKELIYVFLFMAGLLFIPIFAAFPRYYLPFVFYYFLLCLRGLESLLGFIPRVRLFKKIYYSSRMTFVIFLCILTGIYSYYFCKNAYAFKRYSYAEYYNAAQWIKSVAGLKQLKIMGLNQHLAYLSDSRFIPLPYEFSLEKIIRFAQSKGVDYIILEKNVWGGRRDQWKFLMETQGQNPFLNLVYHDQNDHNEILIFQLRKE